MTTISVPDKTLSRMRLLARAWKTTEAGAIERLLNEFESGGDGDAAGALIPSGDGPSSPGAVGIHFLYEGERINAEFDPGTEAVTVLDGPLAGKRFRTPSGAAVAVVQQLSPDVNPNRNGWSTWIITATGERLQSIRRR